MSDLISRQAVLKIFEDRFIELQKARRKDTQLGVNWCINTLKDMSPVNPQEPKAGRWIESDAVLVMGYSETDNFLRIPAKECSVCHKPHIRAYRMNYCPNCGAKMESEDKE